MSFVRLATVEWQTPATARIRGRSPAWSRRAVNGTWVCVVDSTRRRVAHLAHSRPSTTVFLTQQSEKGSRWRMNELGSPTTPE